MWSIQDVAMALGTEPDQRSFSNGMGFAVNCAEDVAFSSLDDAETALADSPYPQLASFPMAVNKQSLLSCLSYPTALDPSVAEPVVSDIPALVFVGHLDVETPISWGRDVATRLSRSTVVAWENQGHIAAAHDQQLCAGGIAAGFLDDPSRDPDLTCAQSDDYTIDFALE
jgi:pimeloyl-ACP methyl ester carboxylesterase